MIHYFVYMVPPMLLMLWAQMRVKSAYAAAQQLPAPLSGAAAARHVLDSAGLNNVAIEEVPGELTDHYDPRDKVLRLSTPVYNSRTLAAVGIAAHEAGHALQDAKNYAPLAIRNAAVPVANFGSSFGIGMIILGAVLLHSPMLVMAGHRAVCRLRLFSTGESAGRIRRQQSGESPTRAIGHHRRRRARACPQRAERGRLDLCGRHAAGGDDAAVLPLDFHRRRPRPRLTAPAAIACRDVVPFSAGRGRASAAARRRRRRCWRPIAG